MFTCCQSKIDNSSHPLGIEQNVRRLEITVHDSLLVSVMQPVRDLLHKEACFSDREAGPCLDAIGEALALNEFHGQELQAVYITGISCADDVRMIEFADYLHFPMETVNGPRPFEPRFGQQLQGHKLA